MERKKKTDVDLQVETPVDDKKDVSDERVATDEEVMDILKSIFG